MATRGRVANLWAYVQRTPADALLLLRSCHSTDERRKRRDRAGLHERRAVYDAQADHMVFDLRM
jgi:hypothetical protein